MKQRDLIKRLEDGGFIFERHGGKMTGCEWRTSKNY